jgi:hypothetical protein
MVEKPFLWNQNFVGELAKCEAALLRNQKFSQAAAGTF